MIKFKITKKDIQKNKITSFIVYDNKGYLCSANFALMQYVGEYLEKLNITFNNKDIEKILIIEKLDSVELVINLTDSLLTYSTDNETVYSVKMISENNMFIPKIIKEVINYNTLGTINKEITVVSIKKETPFHCEYVLINSASINFISLINKDSFKYSNDTSKDTVTGNNRVTNYKLVATFNKDTDTKHLIFFISERYISITYNPETKTLYFI